MKFKSRIYCIIILFIIIAPLAISTNYVFAHDLSQGLEIPLTPRGFNIVIDHINLSNIMEHVKFFSSASRFTGYPGFFEAANYIAKKFEEYGLQPRGENGTYFEYFEVTIPIDHGVSITLENGDIIRAYMPYLKTYIL
ncbi:MAG: hypothetical protein QXX94_02655 [Candidatus Bathyarchaeia archaeon]